MNGEPDDVEGECNARLFIADNYGDNSATIRCQRPIDHEGPHQETFARKGPVTVTWAVDERQRCDHGCGQWDHDHADIIRIATARINGSHGNAQTQNGLRYSERSARGYYKVQIAGVLPPDALVEVFACSPATSSTSTVTSDGIYVRTCDGDEQPVDADFDIEITT